MMNDANNTDRQTHGQTDRESDTFLTRRRDFLRTVGVTGALTTVGAAGIGMSTAQLPSDPFTLGVASGDPLPDSVVLWTRLAPEPLAADGGMPDSQVSVDWEVATDSQLQDVVQNGTVQARPNHVHSVHVDVTGLNPNTEYYYQFTADTYQSSIGRTKTAPTADASVEAFKFAFASCQNYPYGYYTAHQHLADEELDVVFHLGDYIYEGDAQGSLGRGHEPPREIQSLADYRIRHAQYKSDTDLQAAHAAAPWIVTWDDHEVANNYADEIDEGTPPDEFLDRRASAYQAYWEHQPIRRSRMPDGPDMPLYRRFKFGTLAEFNVLDTRQYRDDQTSSDGATDPARTILGDEQEDWLLTGLEASDSRWNVLAQQVPFAATDEDADPDAVTFGGGDKWDGYRADRETLLDVMASNNDLNPVVITGDVHRNYAYNLKADFADPDSETVGTEYIGTSISSFGDTSGLTQYGPSTGEPWQRFFNVDRGYVRCTLTPEQWQTDYRIVSTVEAPTASVRTLASFATEAGAPGATLVSEQPVQESIEITTIQANAAGSDSGNLNGELVRLQNSSATAIDLSDFILSFEGGGGQNYTFGAFTLGAGETVTVRNGSGADTQSTLYTGFTGSVLNNTDPDTVVVANDENIIIDEQSYHPVEISEIQANAPGRDSDNLNGEFVRLRNHGDTAIDFSGFVLSFEGGQGQNYTFSTYTLGAGETVTVRNGSGTDTQSTRYTGFTGAVLNNTDPDTVIVTNDAGIVLDTGSYQPS